MTTDVEALLDEVATVLAGSRWILVGGLMVHLLAENAGIEHGRPTTDVDVVVKIAAGTYVDAAEALVSAGFAAVESVDPHAPFHRFRRGEDIVDLMAEDRRRATFRSRAVLRVPGSTSALENSREFSTAGGVRVHLPEIWSALSLKGAAVGMSSPNPDRHLQDAVTLFACAYGEDPPELSKTMRKNVNTLIRRLGVPSAWAVSPAQVRRRAVDVICSVRPDWRPPPGVLPQRFR